MKQDNDKIIATLDRLIDACRDRQQGFHAAAEAVSAGDVKELLTSYAGQRARFAAELQEQVRQYGGHPDKGGTVTGALHRGWVQLKSAVLGTDEAGILAECGRGEESAMKQYEAAVTETLPPDLAAVIATQYREIKDAHGRLHELQHPAARA